MRNYFSFSVTGILLAALMVTSFGAFAAKVTLEFTKKEDPNYPVRYGLVLEEACDADVLKFDLYRDGDKSNFGQIEAIKITKSNGGKTCRLNRELSPKDINGKILEVRLYKEAGRNLQGVSTLFIRVPCENNAIQMSNTLNGGVYNLKDQNQLKNFSCGNSGNSVNTGSSNNVQIGPNDQQPQQSCSGAMNLANNGAEVQISARCTLTEKVAVLITSGDRVISERNVNMPSNSTVDVAVVNRVKTSSLPLKVKITSAKAGRSFEESKIYYKAATFNHQPEGRYQTDRNITPAPQNKAMGRGQYWETTIKVGVHDGDIEERFPQDQITVQLLNVKTGQLIAEQTLSTGEVASFAVEAQYIEPLMFGDAKWDAGAALQKGDNVLKVRIFDAYQKVKYIDLDDIHINVVSDKK